MGCCGPTQHPTQNQSKPALKVTPPAPPGVANTYSRRDYVERDFCTSQCALQHRHNHPPFWTSGRLTSSLRPVRFRGEPLMPTFYDADRLTPAQIRAAQAAAEAPDRDLTRRIPTAAGDHDLPEPADVFASMAADDARVLALHRFQPKASGPRVDAVRATVVALVARIAFVSEISDRVMMSLGFRYALWCHRQHGHFDPKSHLTEQHIGQYQRHGFPDQEPTTVAAHVAALRRFAAGRRVTRGISRKAALPPYSKHTVDVFEDIAQFAAERNRDDLTMLLRLTFGMGLRPDEIQRAQVNWVQRVGSRTLLQVPDPNGVVREIPAIGHTHLWLKAWAQDHNGDEYLFRNDYSSRRNAINSLVAQVSKTHPELRQFKASRARHTWLIRLLSTPMPFNAICQMAGINANSHLPTDLMPYLRPITAKDQHNALIHALSAENDRDN